MRKVFLDTKYAQLLSGTRRWIYSAKLRLNTKI